MKTLTTILTLTLTLLGTVRGDTFSSVTINGTTGTNLTTTGPGGAIFGGTFGSGDIPTTVSGTRMMWLPAKAAFRVGYVDSGRWDNANIGDYSVGLGTNSSAPGFGAIAFGSGTASGWTAVSLGWNGNSTGSFATALANSTASNTFTFAAASGSANGYQSIALGGLATGNYSTAVGVNATSVAVGSTVVGQYNVITGVGDPATPAAADPIFVVGTGTATNARMNGLEVRRDGTVRLGKAQGDISMGEFAP